MNKNLAKRIFWCMIGVSVIGVGCAVFKVSNLGNDAFTALNITISERTGISLGTVTLLVNCVYFLAPLFFGRKYINIGTILNGGLLGYLIDFFYKTLVGIFGRPEAFISQLIWLVPGVIIISLGLSLYQNADLGVGPYDYLALGMRDHLKLPYFGCRIFTDGMCALGAWLLGGLVGLGTLVCAFCLGPFVSFFDRNVSAKLMNH